MVASRRYPTKSNLSPHLHKSESESIKPIRIRLRINHRSWKTAEPDAIPRPTERAINRPCAAKAERSITTTPSKKLKRISSIDSELETTPSTSPPASVEVFEKITSRKTSSQLQAELLRKDKAYTHLERTNRILRRTNYQQECEIRELKTKNVKPEGMDGGLKYCHDEYREGGMTGDVVLQDLRCQAIHDCGNDLMENGDCIRIKASQDRPPPADDSNIIVDDESFSERDFADIDRGIAAWLSRK